jgi:hypothetical protein
MPSREEKGHFFGSYPIVSTSGLLALDSEKRELNIYDLATAKQLRQCVFAEPVVLKAFSMDGKRLLVLTSDQTVYLLDVANPSGAEPALASNPVK